MTHTFTVRTDVPSFEDITSALQVCVVTVSQPYAAIAFAETGNERVQADILNELNIVFPPRVDYKAGGDPHISTARTKAALMVGSKEISIQDGKPQLAAGRSVYVVDFVGGETIEVNVHCI